MNDKYLILSEQKYSNIPSNWSVEYFNQTYDQAFEKLVCLEKLKEDKDKIYYLMPCKHLWTHGQDVKQESEKIKNSAEETDQDELPF
tara:strand:+ start:506 stop:766 length:261 start_codon:yes stop_codon:yes gene_type:complete